jgi:hypothetical protein
MRPLQARALARTLPSCLRLVCLAAALGGLPAVARGAEDAPAGDGLGGHAIYQKVLANRFERFRQDVRLVSGDRAGNTQESRMSVLWKSFRDDAGQPVKGVLSKTIVRYTHPFDLRFSGYLVINNADRSDDQFVYLNSRRRVRRVNLRGEPVMGSDFSFEDVVPRELEDARYERQPDEVHDGRQCHVVEVFPTPESDSEYSKLRSWIDRERFVVLRTLYWDADGVQTKELLAPSVEVREFEGIWTPMQTEMKNLPTESWSRFHIEHLEANPPVDDGEFDPRRLESH